MKKLLKNIGAIVLLMLCYRALAEGGALFNISSTGTPANINITLCLNAKGQISCQNYDVSGLTLNIFTTIPNRSYISAGIKINTPGYKIENSGIDCTPSTTGYCLFSVSDTTSKVINLMNSGSLTISPSSLPAAALDTSYSQTITASDGVAPYTYAITSGSLPTGLSLNTETGVISGTPIISGGYTFTITATDSYHNNSSRSYLISVGVIAYILNNNTSNVSYCYINSDGSFGSCNYTGDGTTYNYGLTINTSEAYAYITHYGSGSLVSYCPINADGTFNTCQDTGNNMLAASGIAINSLNTFAYIANNASSGPNSIIYCPINSNASFGTCLGTGAAFFSNPMSINLNPSNTYAYVINGNGNVYYCIVNNNGTIGACNTTGSNFHSPTFMTFSTTNSKAYFTNYNGNQVTYCTVNVNGTLSACTLTGSLPGPAFGIAINAQGTIAYITSRDTNDVLYCPININGSLGTCNTTGSGFSAPANIVLKNP